MAQIAPYIFPQFFDDNGDPLNGGLIYAYAAGTTTPQNTYSNAAGTSANTNPIVLSSSGRTKVFLQNLAYDFVIKNSAGETIDSISGVGSAAISGGASFIDTISELRALASGAFNYVEVGGYAAKGDGGGGLFYWDATETAADLGINVQPNSLPAAGRWVREYSGKVNVKWFGAKGDTATDDLIAIAAANTYVASLTNGGTLYFPESSGGYLVTSNPSFNAKTFVRMESGAYFTSAGVAITFVGFYAEVRRAFSATVGAVTITKPDGALRPEWWGALGDASNDDAPAINAALACAGRSNVRRVDTIGGLTYRCNSGLEIPSGVWLNGEGKRLAGLKFYHTDGTPSINFANGYYQQLTNINIDHNDTANSAQGILMRDNDGSSGTDSPQYPLVRNVKIWRHQTGIRVVNEVTWALFEDVNIEFCETAYSISNANFTHFLRCIANANGTAWYIEDTSKCVLTHCTAQVCSSTTVPAIQIVDATGTTIENLWCERNEFTCVLVKGSSALLKSRFTKISECWLNGAGFTSPNTGWGLDIGANCEETTVDGGRFGGNATGDIRINVDSSGNIIRQPHSLSALVITDAADDTQYWDYTQMVINPPTTHKDVVNVVRSGLGVTTAPGVDLKNETAAAAGAQQVSPALEFKGAGWKTNATAASQTVEMRAYVVPVEGAAAPTGYLVIERSIAGGAWAEVGRFNAQSLLIASNGATDLGNPFFMQLARDGSVGYAASRYSNDATAVPSFTGRSAQGSFAAQAATTNSSPLVSLDGMGHDGTSIQTAPKVRVLGRAIENWSGGANGTEILIQVTPAGSTTMATVFTLRSALLTAAAMLARKATDAITASTTQTQLQGQLVSDINIVSVCANANDTVTLPSASAGMRIFIRNNGVATLQIFPFTGDAINSGAVNASATLAAGASVTYQTANATTWYS